MIKKKIQKGFTLIEVMISLFILLMIGLLISQGLNSVLRTHDTLKNKIKDLAEIQSAMVIIERDMQQIIAAEILGPQRERQPWIMVTPNGFLFSRVSMFSPITQQKNIELVTYLFSGNSLFRLSQSIINTIPSGTVSKRVLLKNIDKFKASVIQIPDPSFNNKTTKPIGVIIEMIHPTLGIIKRVFYLSVNQPTEAIQ